MTATVKDLIVAGDATGLMVLLTDDPPLANVSIEWGPDGANLSLPLHFVSDMVFDGTLAADRAVPLVDALIAAGAALDAPHARHGDTPLIGAASLSVEDVGLRLVAAGADIAARGLFGATALHWAAHQGLATLTAALLDAGADVALPDSQYGGRPLDWALHGWHEPAPGDTRGQPGVARLLRAAGATPRDGALAALDGAEHAAMRAALTDPV